MAVLHHFLAVLGLLTPLIRAVVPPPLPLHSSSRWILDADNNRVKLRCVNWAGHMETNVPEGLQHQSIDFIVDWIAAQNFTCVRLTYSTDHALNPDLPVAASFAAAARDAGVPAADMTALYSRVVARNPWITPATTTRDVYAAAVDKLFARGVLTLLDNHVSKASWCCHINDGNGWWDAGAWYNPWNSRHFDTQKWLDGLQAMAAWSLSHPGVVAVGLRNEIREFLLQGTLNGRADWYTYVKRAGDLVHATNPDVLVVVGGTQSTTDLLHIRDGGRMLDTSGWEGKHVWEMHAYSFTVTFPDVFDNCDVVKTQYGAFSGFVLEQGKAYTGPMMLSEFGVGMEGGEAQYQGLSAKDDKYLKCLVSYMQNNDADWAVWAIQGSYYVRDKKVDIDETWGLMNHDWSDWRNPAFPGMLGDMWKMTQQP
ncbi:glycoside hydrolase family 5 protein [Parathielavia hyrcaniae]|uniref:Glycoside hydrolase family 5 protein n=1 Tax=Parathielavia hyrcaniae TaxID=113614 RepID=A0AAN6QB16_9PEZI|nr:glycoside hydrolase family 5 protein [Parathielavia hyrcaniae]